LSEHLRRFATKSVAHLIVRSKTKSEPDVPDIYAERDIRSEDEFRLWLRDQSVPVLRAIIRKHDLDSARRTARWRDAEKLAAYIADRLQGRLERGSSFMREVE
jgi:hypothetical protein